MWNINDVFTVIIIIMVVVVILIIIITSTIIIITIIITVIIIMTISNRYYYYCYFLSFIIIFYNNFRYSCHHTDMTSYQISTLNFLCISVDSHMLYPPPSPKKKGFFVGPQRKWNHTAFLCYSCYRNSDIFLSSILPYSSVFDCTFIWKSYVNFSFIEFIFVLVKDTYWLAYLLTGSSRELKSYKFRPLFQFWKKICKSGQSV